MARHPRRDHRRRAPVHAPDAPEPVLYFEERADGNPYLLRIFTFDYVDHDPAQVEGAIRAAKPAGLLLDYQVRHGQTWAMLEAGSATWADVQASYATWGDVFNAAPTTERSEP